MVFSGEVLSLILKQVHSLSAAGVLPSLNLEGVGAAAGQVEVWHHESLHVPAHKASGHGRQCQHLPDQAGAGQTRPATEAPPAARRAEPSVESPLSAIPDRRDLPGGQDLLAVRVEGEAVVLRLPGAEVDLGVLPRVGVVEGGLLCDQFVQISKLTALFIREVGTVKYPVRIYCAIFRLIKKIQAFR